MPVFGDLRTMTLCDLLQWAGVNRKTGVLELERNKVCRRIEFRKGRIGACSSDDPPSLLGQFLLARGKIDRDQLRDALARQQESHQNLGLILHGMGCLSHKDLSQLIKAKAEETIQGLFDWEDAIFRFHEGATLEPNQIEVSLSVDDVLLTGDPAPRRAGADPQGLQVVGAGAGPHGPARAEEPRRADDGAPDLRFGGRPQDDRRDPAARARVRVPRDQAAASRCTAAAS